MVFKGRFPLGLSGFLLSASPIFRFCLTNQNDRDGGQISFPKSASPATSGDTKCRKLCLREGPCCLLLKGTHTHTHTLYPKSLSISHMSMRHAPPKEKHMLNISNAFPGTRITSLRACCSYMTVKTLILAFNRNCGHREGSTDQESYLLDSSTRFEPPKLSKTRI